MRVRTVLLHVGILTAGWRVRYEGTLTGGWRIGALNVKWC